MVTNVVLEIKAMFPMGEQVDDHALVDSNKMLQRCSLIKVQYALSFSEKLGRCLNGERAGKMHIGKVKKNRKENIFTLYYTELKMSSKGVPGNKDELSTLWLRIWFKILG